MEGILERFCTPPADDTDDAKALEGAREGTVKCGERNIATYEWGDGESVLLAHGWGSRASHMALIARGLARQGFRVMAFDGPAHGRSRQGGGPPQSSMFEFCECLAAVAREAGPFHAIAGHSIGAAAAVFITAGYARLSPLKTRADKLVLISMPSGVARMMRSFCARDGGSFDELKPALEHRFSFRVDDYMTSPALSATGAEILVIHDEDDEEVPVSEARALADSHPTVTLLLTRGSGHGRVLVNRETLRAIVGFLRKTRV
jgi:pimeloyl-ACP methyl ester carboxylesterase